MARKSIGYVKLEWVCPNCNTKNPGPQKTCSACGAPQPADVKFIKAVHDVLISDEKELEMAKAGANVHCPYCGARNLSGAEICTQCGANLSEAKARLTGQVLGALQNQAQAETRSIACPACQTPNLFDAAFCIACGASLTSETTPGMQADAFTQPPAAPALTGKKMNPLVIIMPVALVVLAFVLFLIFSNKKTDLTAQVTDVSWVRSIVVEEYGPVSDTDWRANIPSDAIIGDCDYEYHHTSSEPEAVSTEVCGTPYVVDNGTGYGEAVTDCEYEVYEERCEFTTDQWHALTTVSLDGTGNNPSWPNTNLTSSQREGDRSEEYRILFDTGSDTYTYTTGSFDEYQQYGLGSDWLLTVNAFGRITKILPAD